MAREKKESSSLTEVTNSSEQYLNQDELHQLKVAGLQEELRGMNRAIMDRDIRLLQCEAEIARQKSEVARHRLLIMKQEHTEQLQSHINWWNGIKARFDLKDDEAFGYSPESGLVTITKKETKG
jgi:chromosome segregation ATPase